jgi:hypothetical protein
MTQFASRFLAGAIRIGFVPLRDIAGAGRQTSTGTPALTKPFAMRDYAAY